MILLESRRLLEAIAIIQARDDGDLDQGDKGSQTVGHYWATELSWVRQWDMVTIWIYWDDA